MISHTCNKHGHFCAGCRVCCPPTLLGLKIECYVKEQVRDILLCVCVCVRVCSSFWLPTASRDGDWQDCDTKGVGYGEGRGWITKKNQFLPYACDLFQYIESFTDWKESNGRVNPLS